MSRNSDLCRLCMSTYCNLTPIFSDRCKFALDIYLITGLKITEFDHHKAFICDFCQQSLSIAINLRNVSITSNIQFEKSIRSTECQIFARELQSVIEVKHEEALEIKSEEIFCEPISTGHVAVDVEEESISTSGFQINGIEKDGKFICPYCSKSLSGVSRLKYHIQVKHHHTPYCGHFCDYCGQEFPRYEGIKKHLKKRLISKICPSKRDCKCPHCEIQLTSEHSLKYHIKVKHEFIPNTNEYFCNICKREFSNEKPLLRHMKARDPVTHKKLYSYAKKDDSHWKKIEMIENRMKCPHCPTTLSCKSTLQDHIGVMHETHDYGCDLCGKNYAFKYAIRKHMKLKHTMKENAIEICPHCKQFYNSETSLRQHIADQHEVVLGTFPCEVCGIIYPTKKTLNQHLKQSHGKRPKYVKREGNFICPTCAKIFRTSSNLSQHEKTHRVLLPSEYFYCDLCGNKFKEKTPMATHIRSRHIKKIRFHCQFCPKDYTTKYHLSTHIKVQHYNIRDYKCEYCGKEFGEKKKLDAHVRIHTGEQPFQCQYCERKFTHQTDYRRHVWNHEGHKRFICKNENCNLGFMKKAELQSHQNRCRAKV